MRENTDYLLNDSRSRRKKYLIVISLLKNLRFYYLLNAYDLIIFIINFNFENSVIFGLFL